MSNTFGYQPSLDDPDLRPPPDTRIRCAACHTVLLDPPIGMTAGLCPGLSCLQLGVVTPARLHDYMKMVAMVSAGLMVFEPEVETGITWLRQLPPKAPPKPTPIVMDSGEPRYVDWRPDLIIGGGDDGQQ
jgi:hypothetical protein